MKLHAPFIISARLLPALKVGDATLSLAATRDLASGRTGTTLVLDFADGTKYSDDTLRSGMGGFRSTVEIFETFLSFLSATGEAHRYKARTGQASDNDDLFPPHVMQWAADNQDGIETAQCDLRDDTGAPRHELIED